MPAQRETESNQWWKTDQIREDYRKKKLQYLPLFRNVLSKLVTVDQGVLWQLNFAKSLLGTFLQTTNASFRISTIKAIRD